MMGQGDKKIRIRRTNEQLDKEVISEFEKLVGEFGFGNVNLSALMKAADLEANVFYRRYGSMDNLYDSLIEKFKIIRFEQDQKQKDRIYLDIHMTPFFPAKSFVIKLDGTKGDDGTNWNTNYEQA